MESNLNVGDKVFLMDRIGVRERVLGSAIVISIDPRKIVHSAELGDHCIQVQIECVHECPEGDEHEICVGSFLRWRKTDCRPFNQYGPTFNSSTGSNDLVKTETTLLDNEETPFIPRHLWSGMSVDVLDDNDVLFATATVQLINMHMVWRGEVIGEDHVILFFTGPSSSDSEAVQLFHNCKDQLKKWRIDKIRFGDGNTGKYHLEQAKLHFSSENNSGHMRDPSKKRKYTTRVRARKLLSGKLKKCDRELQTESISSVSHRLCCKRLCTEHIPFSVVKKSRVEYFAKSFSERKAFTIDAMINNITLNDGVRVIAVQGIPMCLTAWRLVHCQGKSQFALTMKDVSRGIIETSHGNTGKSKMTARVSQALETMTAVIDENAEYHPAKIRILADNSHAVKRQLPCAMNWGDVLKECNSVNLKSGLSAISQPKISELRKKYFKEVDIHKMGDNFSKCTKCCEFKHRRPLCRTVQEKLILDKEKEEHLDEQRQGRALYYAWRDDAVRHPEKSICIMHDKMDHNKTSTPRYAECPKQLDGLQKMPITVTGILTHGRAPYAITQYNVACWPSDSNATIGSIASTIRMLEDHNSAKEIFLEKENDSTELFSALLCGRLQTFKSIYDSALPTGPSVTQENIDLSSLPETQQKLPRLLRLQLDNCGSDNKNKYIFAYLSLLVANGIFEEVELAFLMVGHTHEDVDAMFGHFSYALTHKTNLDLMSMMKNFHDAYANSEGSFPSSGSRGSSSPAIPTFVQEVPDFKSWVEPYLFTGSDALIGIREPRRFRFYMRSDGMPCVQYMVKSINVPWLPQNGIEMWKWKDDFDSNRVPDIPAGSPKRAPITEIKMLGDVIQGIGVWIRFFNTILKRCEGTVAAVNYEACVVYWTRILEILQNGPINYDDGFGEELKFGFWPKSRWRDSISSAYQRVQCEIEEDDHYFGPRSQKPLTTFQPLRDVDVGDFVLCRPHEEDLYPVFLGRVKTAPRLGDTNESGNLEHVFDVQWYCPKRLSRQSEIEQWENCWTKQWVPTETWKELGVLSTVVWSFKVKRGANLNGIKITPKNAKAAQDNLLRCMQAENEDS